MKDPPSTVIELRTRKENKSVGADKILITGFPLIYGCTQGNQISEEIVFDKIKEKI